MKSDPELVRVGEDIPVDTEPLPLPLPPPRQMPRQPPRLELHKGRESSYVELSAQLATQSKMLADVVGYQRKLALQVDGLGSAMNQRFDIFHEELALLRATVSGDHAPRLETVERSLGQKAARGGGIVALVAIALPMLADALPKYRHLFEALAGAFQ